jgi:cytochrome c oxidase assembly protein subunit 15
MNLEHRTMTAVHYPRWLRGWCAATAAATFALIGIGTLVTTFHVGMADPLWPTAPWHLLLIERVPNFGFYVEHTHRLAGYSAGILILVQTLALWWLTPDWRKGLVAFVAVAGIAAGCIVGMWFVRQAAVRSVDTLFNPGFLVAIASAVLFFTLALFEVKSRVAGRWQRAIVTVAFVGVVVQGMLGGLRVYLNELRGPDLALIHGLFAQVVFAATVLLALMATRRWNSMTDLLTEPPLRWLTAATAGLVVMQIVFGGLLRHLHNPIAERLHPLLAFAVLLSVGWTFARAFQDGVVGGSALRGKALALVTLVGFQVALGIEAWIRTASTEARLSTVSVGDATIRSLHVLTGFGVYASAALLAARAWKARLI